MEAHGSRAAGARPGTYGRVVVVARLESGGDDGEVDDGAPPLFRRFSRGTFFSGAETPTSVGSFSRSRQSIRPSEFFVARSYAAVQPHRRGSSVLVFGPEVISPGSRGQRVGRRDASKIALLG